MLKRDEISNEKSCLNQAGDLEPLFVLRANDELAPVVVDAWCFQYKMQKGGFERMTPAQKAKYQEARELARQMRIWKGTDITEDKPEFVRERDDSATYDILQLVSCERVTLQHIGDWTDDQVQEVEAWAGAIHAKASDNDDVVVPATPECLKGLTDYR